MKNPKVKWGIWFKLATEYNREGWYYVGSGKHYAEKKEVATALASQARVFYPKCRYELKKYVVRGVQ
jgi:hypothetical protein